MGRILLLLAILMIGFAPAPLPSPGRNTCADLAALRGEWERVSIVLSGKVGHVKPGQVTAIFKDNQLSFLSDGIVTARWTVVLDATQKPKAMDLRGDKPKNVLLGIYRREGDVLTFSCDDVGTGIRPRDFTERNRSTEVLKRKKQ
jgi:uncharacterized protein (TIGR03067 family)